MFGPCLTSHEHGSYGALKLIVSLIDNRKTVSEHQGPVILTVRIDYPGSDPISFDRITVVRSKSDSITSKLH
jgi:hypothetical protein